MKKIAMKLRLAGLLLPVILAVEVLAQAPAAKTMGKDEVFFSIARRINSISESPVSAIVTELDGLIEVTALTAEADGRSLVTVKERAPSSAAFTNKSTRLRFSPPPAGGREWTWVEFEENRRFYPVEKIFPYAKDELNRRKQATVAKWTAFIGAVSRQIDAGIKVMETARAVLKADPPPLAALTALRTTLAAAIKESDRDPIISVSTEAASQNDPIGSLADTYTDLKANDAYLRLIEEQKGAVTATDNARRDYVQSVAAYNELLLRLPYTLVAYGTGFTKLEAKLEE